MRRSYLHLSDLLIGNPMNRAIQPPTGKVFENPLSYHYFIKDIHLGPVPRSLIKLILDLSGTF